MPQEHRQREFPSHVVLGIGLEIVALAAGMAGEEIPRTLRLWLVIVLMLAGFGILLLPQLESVGQYLRHGRGAKYSLTHFATVILLGAMIGVGLGMTISWGLWALQAALVEDNEHADFSLEVPDVDVIPSTSLPPEPKPTAPVQTETPETQTSEPADLLVLTDQLLTPQDIEQRINDVPLLMRQELANSFVGLEMTCRIRLHSIDAGEEEGTVELFGPYADAGIGAVLITAIVKNSPRFTPLKRGAKLTVSGPIQLARIDGGGITLAPAVVISIESYGGE